VNPNGIPQQSPGLRGTSYPGATNRESKPQWGFGFGECTPLVATPLGLLFFALLTQGSSSLATLIGFGTQSLWDWQTFNIICARMVVGASYFWSGRFPKKSFNLFPNLRIDL
jgi:hypothetical protein